MICLKKVAFYVLFSSKCLGFWWSSSLEESTNIYQNYSRRFPRKTTCKITALKIEQCEITISRLGNEKITVTYEKSCEIKDMKFAFYFGREGGYFITFDTENPYITVDDMKKQLKENKNTIFEIGTHFILVKMQAQTMKNEPLSASSPQCHFYVRPENVTATLGPLNKNVKKGSTILVDASKSKNNDVGKIGEGLLYRWSCVDNVEFCQGRDLGTSSRVSIDKEYAQEGARFVFTVEVRTEQTTWQKAFQYINVNSSMPYTINCIKNCGKEPNTWNPRISPWIFSECEFSCNTFHRADVIGRLIDEGGNILAEYNDIASSPVSVVNVQKPGKRYKVRMYHEQNKKETIVGETDFYNYPLPKLENCKTIPPNGSPLTKFKLSCDYDKETVKMFRLQIKTNNTVVYSTSASTLEEIEFVVASHSDVFITIEDTNEVTNIQDVIVDVEPFHDADTNVTDVADAMFGIHGGQEGMNSVYLLIQQGQYETALQVIGIIAGAISDLEVNTEDEKAAIRTLKKELLTDLSGVPIDTIDIAKSVSGIVGMLAKPNADDDSDPVMTKLLSAICSEVAKRQLYLKQNDHSEKINDEDIATIAKNLLKCSDVGTTPNYDIFNQTDLMEIEFTTKYPIREELSEIISFEDYPQYVADDIIEDQVQNFIEVGENVLDVCRDTSNSILSTLNSNMKSPKYLYGMKSIISMMKSSGRLLSMAEFKQHNVTIVPSPYLKKLKSTLTMRVCSYEYNPFWSASIEMRIPTSVLNVGIMTSADKREITRFGELPMNITFELLKDSGVKAKITKSKLYDLPWKSLYIEDNFTIFIVGVKNGESFFIEFYNLTETDKIDIAIGNMKRPVLHFFANGAYVDMKKPKIFVEVSETVGDKWILIGMKPNSAMRLEGSMNIWFSMFTPRCIRWDSRKKSWKFACSVHVTTTPQTIHCKCFHLSTLAGYIEYNILKEHPKFHKIEFLLEMKGSLYIISFVVLLYSFYFFLLIYSIRKGETLEDTVFFMADVPASCRYAYLVVVKTGERLGSGTTSDIVLEVIGVNGSSLKHVLNFPDPFFEMLRRSSEDYLVFASKIHLGHLKRINLSFDCSGSSPNWFCHSVKICDLQTKHWYKFKVKKWLRFDDNSRWFMSVPVSEKVVTEEESKKKRLIKGALKFGKLEHTMWQLMKRSDDPNFEPIKRSTMMLSVVSTLMAISLKFYGTPEFLPRDSLTKHCFFEFHLYQLFIGLYSATLVFFPHLALMTGFKNSRTLLQPKTARYMLPVYCTYIFWAILLINVLVQTHILILYGSRFIYPTTWEWTLSWLIALIFYIFILEFLLNLILDIFVREFQSTRVNFSKMLKNIEVQRQYLYKLFGKDIYRPILDPVYNFLAGAKYLARRLYYKQRWDVTWQMQDLLMTILLMICFYLVVRGERDKIYDILGHREVLTLLKGAEHNRVKLKDVTQTSDFYEYMEKTFIPTIQSLQWYGRYMSLNPGMTSDTCNKYLGVVRLRQHRVETETCSVPEQMKFLNTKCYSSFYFCEYDFQNYTPHWKYAISKIYSSRMGYVWGFQEDTGNTFFGDTAYYPVGGYVALLGRTINNSYINFSYLKRQNWLDHRTRAILIEFCIYNINSNVFHFVEVLFERSSTGFISSRIRVMTERVLKYGSKKNYLSLICAVTFIIFVIIISVRIIIRLFKTRTWNKSHLWHLLDIAIVAFSFSWVVMHFKKLSLLQEFAKELEEKQSNAFVDFFEMTKVVNNLNFLNSFLVTLTILRLWKLLRFAAVFRVVERTIAFSFETLFLMFIIFTVYEIGFGFMGYVFLGSKLEDFKDWYSTLKIMINLMAQTLKSSPGNLGQNQRGLGYVFFVFYTIFCFILSTMFIAIIVYNYNKARQYAFEERTEYSMKDYTYERFHHLKRLAALWMEKFRLNAGGTEEHVNPKPPCSRYMNFVETDSNRMKAMASVAKCVLMKRLKGARTDASDHIMMMKMVLNLLDKTPGEREIFFVEGNIISGNIIVDDRKILKMEKVVKSLLESPEERAVRRRRTDLIETLEADNLARMMQINYRLNLMLKAVSNIEISLQKEGLLPRRRV